MGYLHTPIRGRQYPDENASPDVASDLGILANALDTAPVVTQGVLAARPAAAAAGNRYMVEGDSTQANNGHEWYDTGSVWVPATPGVMPIGAMMQWAGSGDPEDFDSTVRWLVCNGRAISRTTYAALFAALATAYGTGDGSTTFNIPDLRGRVPVGADPTGVHLPVNEPALGGSGGEEQHALVTAEGASHDHTLAGGEPVPYLVGGSWSLGGEYATASGSLFPAGSTGGSLGSSTVTSTTASATPHNNLQPYLAVNHIIRVI